MGVKVTLTVQAGNREPSHVDAEGDTYETAKALIPEGSKAIAIRTSYQSHRMSQDIRSAEESTQLAEYVQHTGEPACT